HLRHIEVFELASQCIHHQLRSQCLRELGGIFEQSLPQLSGTIYSTAVGQDGVCVDRRLSLCIDIAPSADRIKVFKSQPDRVDGTGCSWVSSDAVPSLRARSWFFHLSEWTSPCPHPAVAASAASP